MAAEEDDESLLVTVFEDESRITLFQDRVCLKDPIRLLQNRVLTAAEALLSPPIGPSGLPERRQVALHSGGLELTDAVNLRGLLRSAACCPIFARLQGIEVTAVFTVFEFPEEEREARLKALESARPDEAARIFQSFSADARADARVSLVASGHQAAAMAHACEVLRASAPFMTKAVARNGMVLQWAHPSLLVDRGVVLEAVGHTGAALQFADESLRADRAVASAAVGRDGCALAFVAPSLRQDRQLVLEAVAQNGRALQCAHEALRCDRDVAVEAVRQNWMAMKYMHPSLRSDKEIAMIAIQQNGNALQFLQQHLKADKEIVIAAVKQDGYVLQFADPSLKGDTDVVLKAVVQSWRALQYADEYPKATKHIVIAAAQQNSAALIYAHESLQTDPDVLRTAWGISGAAGDVNVRSSK